MFLINCALNNDHLFASILCRMDNIYDAVDNMEFELAMHMYNIYLLFQILTTLYYSMAKSGIWTYRILH